MTARVVVELLGIRGKPWVLAMDRTNWEFGKATINILMISVIWNGMGIPLIWTLLPSAGNSTGWYVGRDELKPLACTVLVMSECLPTQPKMPTNLIVEAKKLEMPKQRYSLPKFIGDDTSTNLPAPIKVQRRTKGVR